MKKMLAVAGLIMAPAFADGTSGWKRSSNSTYVYFADSSASNVYFQMQISKAGKGKEVAEIMLINTNSEACTNQEVGATTHRTLNVDHRKIKYTAQCQGEKLLLWSETDEGARYVAQRFKKYSKGAVKFRFKHNNRADSIITVPRKGFEKFYAEVQIASKEAL